jgi:iron complex transport system substrate-binding protein
MKCFLSSRKDGFTELIKAQVNLCIILAAFFLLSMGLFSSAHAVVDALGREVKVDSPPLRIVSLAPSITEVLYFLGLGERVAGVTQYSNYPEDAARKPKVGSYVRLNKEKILELSPDLVIGTVDGNNPLVIRALEEAGLKVFLTNPRTVLEAVETISTVARLCHAERQGASAEEGLRKRLNAVVERVKGLPRQLVFLQINLKPIMSVSRNTFHQDVINLAGGVNMTEDAPVTYPRVAMEEILRRNPDVIVISSMERGGQYEEARQEWLKWKSLKAVKDGRVHLIDSDLLDRPSPRLVEGVEQMGMILHPVKR